MSSGSNYPNTPDLWVNKAAGDEVSPTEVNQLRSAVEQLERFVGARVGRSAVQAIPNATITSVFFTTEEYDSANFHSNTVNANRFTVTAAGLYLISGSIIWPLTSGGERYVDITLNGTLVMTAQRITATAAHNHEMNISTIKAMSAGHYVELRVHQTSGGNLDLGNTDLNRLNFSIALLGLG
jgi:hypothetical protein